MDKKITDITSIFALGSPFQRKLLRIPNGERTGRLAALIQTEPNEIGLTWSDSPSSVWAALSTVAADAYDGAFDAVMDPEGSIHVAYSEQSTNDLVTKKLTIGSSGWSIGSKVTIFTGGVCTEPSIEIASDDTLWVVWRQISAPNAVVYIKSSTNDGATWGSGTADNGTELFNGGAFTWARVLIDNSSVHVIRVEQQSGIQMKSLPLSGGSWTGAQTVASGSSFSSGFDVALGLDGRIGVAYDQGGLFYREYDGNNWGAIVSVDSTFAVSPQLVFQNNVPVIVYLRTFSGSRRIPYYADRKAGTFSQPRLLTGSVKPLDSVILFDASAGLYEDLTVESESQTAADVYHSSSGALVQNSGDVIYLGMDESFRFVAVDLSTAGVAGSIAYSYWDGHNWQSFVPVSGGNDLTSVASEIILWADRNSIPVDWQKATVNSRHRFWVRLETVSDYSTGPIGTQVSAVSTLDRIILRR